VWELRGGRAPKYEHRVTEKLRLAGRELAVMCVLMLRGPQTAGEIRGRTGRLCEFTSLAEVESVLEALMSAEPPFATKLPRAAGTRAPGQRAGWCALTRRRRLSPHRRVGDLQGLVDDPEHLAELRLGDDERRVGVQQVVPGEVVHAVIAQVGAQALHLGA